MNQLSIAGFIRPSVHTSVLLVLLGYHQRFVNSLFWDKRGRHVCKAKSFILTQSCPTKPHQPAVRLDATRLWYVFGSGLDM